MADSRMRALWLQDGRLSYRPDAPRPTPGADDVLVRVLKAGVCSTDTGLARGLYSFCGILGHEFVGVATGNAGPLAGQRVVGDINIACGICPQCDAGRPKHCTQRCALGIRGHNGAFADYLVLPRENLHRVHDDVTTDQAVFTEPLAAALEILEQVDITGDDSVLVVGAGKLGQLICRVIAKRCGRISVIARYDAQAQRLEGLAERVTDESHGINGAFDVTIECTGNSEGLEVALRALRARGTLVLKSTYRDRVTLDATRLVVDEIRLVGSRCGPFDKAMSLLARGDLDVETLIDARYRLENAESALMHSRRAGTLKVMLDVSEMEA